MPKWVNKNLAAGVISRLRLSDTRIDPEATPIDETGVKMVIDITSLLTGDPKLATANATIAAQSTYYPCHTVPAGKQWKLKSWNVGKTSGVYILNYAGLLQGATKVKLSNPNLVTNGESAVIPVPEIILEAGVILEVLSSSWTSSGAVKSDITYEESNA